MKLLTPLFALVMLAGCASLDVARAPDISIETKAYAVLSDYEALQSTAVIYVTSPNPNLSIKAKIKAADNKAWPAYNVLKVTVKGEVPLFCETVVPADVTPALAQAACDGNLPSVVSQTRSLVAILAAALRETAP